MKKLTITIVIIAFVATAIITNPAEEKVLNKIENNDDDYFVMNAIRTSQPIFRYDHKFYSKYFNIKRTNLLLFSIYKIDYGWMGNLTMSDTEVDSSLLDKGSRFKSLNEHKSFFGIFNAIY